MAEQFQVRRACFMFIVQVYIYDRHYTPIPLDTETKCSPARGSYVLWRTKQMLLNGAQFGEKRIQGRVNQPIIVGGLPAMLPVGLSPTYNL